MWKNSRVFWGTLVHFYQLKLTAIKQSVALQHVYNQFGNASSSNVKRKEQARCKLGRSQHQPRRHAALGQNSASIGPMLAASVRYWPCSGPLRRVYKEAKLGDRKQALFMWVHSMENFCALLACHTLRNRWQTNALLTPFNNQSPGSTTSCKSCWPSSNLIYESV